MPFAFTPVCCVCGEVMTQRRDLEDGTWFWDCPEKCLGAKPVQVKSKAVSVKLSKAQERAVTECRSLVNGGADPQRVVPVLRERGLDQEEAARVLKVALKLPFKKAKKFVAKYWETQRTPTPIGTVSREPLYDTEILRAPTASVDAPDSRLAPTEAVQPVEPLTACCQEPVVTSDGSTRPCGRPLEPPSSCCWIHAGPSDGPPTPRVSPRVKLANLASKISAGFWWSAVIVCTFVFAFGLTTMLVIFLKVVLGAVFS